jgi:hypothetical protein
MIPTAPAINGEVNIANRWRVSLYSLKKKASQRNNLANENQKKLNEMIKSLNNEEKITKHSKNLNLNKR